MMKNGQTKVPLDRIPAFAAACRIHPVFFLRLALAEYHPEIWNVLVNNIGFPLTANEWDIDTDQLVAPENEIEMTPERTFRVMAALESPRWVVRVNC